MAIELRQYQSEINHNVQMSWNAGNKNVLMVLPTGGGKTVCVSDIVNKEPGAVCVVAHRQELVSQISMALALNGIEHRIVAPPTVVKMISALQRNFLGRTFYNHQSHVAVAGVDTLVRRKKELAHWLPSVKLWVIDECFPAGTMVDNTPIEKIKVGDFVTAFNENTGTYHKRKVKRLFKNPAPEYMVRLETESHHVLHSTKGHPYWTKRGWINAVDLTINDEVLIHGQKSSYWSRVDTKDTGRTKDGYVYNIEVDEFHTYTANEITVHNCHHVLTKNKWGTAVEMFPNARGLGVTATPLRADGKGLGADNDGVFHDMIVGPTMRELIDTGYLTDYRIFAPTSSNLVDQFETARISKATGDYNPNDQSKIIAQSSLVTHTKSTLTGDVVGEYLRIAKGKLGITFVPNMEIGEEITRQYNNAGVPAMLVNAKTPDDERADISRRFENRELLMLVNVDIFGEGYDLPALEVVSFARKTASYGMYVQMFGRVLRILAGKKFGIIIDHVGNVVAHGLPDAPRKWSLARRSKREQSESDDVMPVKSCPECTFVYERYKKACPECGHIPEIAERSGPEFVDGDLSELSPEVLAQMRGEVDHANLPIAEQIMEYRQELLDNYAKPAHIRAHCNRRGKELQQQQISQEKLRNKMAVWGGYRRSEGISDDELMKMFYLKYGVDWISAQALPGKDADLLIERMGEVMQ